MSRIAFVGLGNMGAAMAANVLRAGIPLLLHDPKSKRLAELVALGGTEAKSFAALADADIVISMIPDDKVLSAISLGDKGLVGILKPNALHISMSTVSSQASRNVAQHHKAAGQRFVAAPVFGRPDVATAGQLGIVAAGDLAAIENECKPLFDAMGRITYVAGEDPGAANVIKLGANFLVGTAIEALGEVYALIRKQNVDPELFQQIITTTFFPSPVYRTYGGMIASGNYDPPGFNMLLALKDLTLMTDAADEVRIALPMANLVRNNVLTSIGRGMQEMDYAALGRLAADNAGLKSK